MIYNYFEAFVVWRVDDYDMKDIIYSVMFFKLSEQLHNNKRRRNFITLKKYIIMK